jgi:hypothetical protein
VIRRPTTRRGTAIVIGGSVVIIAVVAFALVYFVLFPTSSPKPFALTTSTAAAPISPGTSLAGTWKVSAGSVAGYRVREKLGFLPAQSDAVGRTSSISGRAAVTQAGSVLTVSSASFVVAVNTLTSDRSMRDQRIHTIGLQSDQYPTATFTLSTPVTLPASATAGHIAHVSATGVFTIHGTAKRETVPLQMSVSSSAIEAVGSLTFPWREFNMTAPSVGGFVNVTDKATMEFDLHLARA